jgi:hypothetical protein
MKTKEKSGLKEQQVLGENLIRTTIEERFGLLRKMVQKFDLMVYRKDMEKNGKIRYFTLRIRSYGHSMDLFHQRGCRFR